MKATAIILAGGKSSRMKYKNKAFLEYEGKRFIDIAIGKAKVFDEIIIVSNTPEQYSMNNVMVVKDIIPDSGPMAGILTGLKYSRNHVTVVFPCDTPLINEEMLRYFVEISSGYHAVMAKVDGFFQPLCAVYTKDCEELFRNALKNGETKLPNLFDQMRIRYVSREEIEEFGDYESMFKNINTKTDYEWLLRVSERRNII
jgi:molybdopterin-guanine dinucleotide biosynthesis protein A